MVATKQVRVVDAESGRSWVRRIAPRDTLSDLLKQTDVAGSNKMVLGPRGRLDLEERIYDRVTEGAELLATFAMVMG